MATLSELRNELRLRLDDVADPQLWSDAELDAYINEAQNEAAIRALLIRDTTTADVVEIAMADADEWLDLHESILLIEYAYITHPVSGNKARITEMGEDELNSSDSVMASKGIPRRFIHVGQQIRFYPIPNDSIDAQLVVRRLPLAAMIDGADAPEIGKQHHFRMLDWAARCAYMKRDSDAYDSKRAVEHEQLFIKSFGEMQDANVRRKHNQREVDTTTPINF